MRYEMRREQLALLVGLLLWLDGKLLLLLFGNSLHLFFELIHLRFQLIIYFLVLLKLALQRFFLIVQEHTYFLLLRVVLFLLVNVVLCGLKLLVLVFNNFLQFSYLLRLKFKFLHIFSLLLHSFHFFIIRLTYSCIQLLL